MPKRKRKGGKQLFAQDFDTKGLKGGSQEFMQDFDKPKGFVNATTEAGKEAMRKRLNKARKRRR